MRLNLGCGEDVRPGYTNVDFRKLSGVDIVVDLSRFPWPFGDGSAEEILMLDFLEHFPYAMTSTILLECHRVLQPHGRLVVQVPDAEQTARALTMQGRYLCNRCGGQMWKEAHATVAELIPEQNVESCPDCGQSDFEIAVAARNRLYGGQDYPGNFHQTAFTANMLYRYAEMCGFANVTHHTPEEREHYYRNWTLHMVLERGEVR